MTTLLAQAIALRDRIGRLGLDKPDADGYLDLWIRADRRVLRRWRKTRGAKQ